MNQYQVNLYDFYSNEVKDALKTFCHRVNHSDADVLIIMAHRTVLLFYLLLAQGHISKQIAKMDLDALMIAAPKIGLPLSTHHHAVDCFEELLAQFKPLQ